MPGEKKKVVLVTGGSRGIGLAVVEAFLDAGYKVAVSARTQSSDVLEMRTRYGDARVYFEPVDVSNWGDATKLVARVIKRFGNLDILVNNAGVSDTHLGFEALETIYRSVFDTNVGGTFAITAAALRPMVRNRWGRIINVSSILAIRGTSGGTIYGAAKAAVLGYTVSLAKELGPKGITVNSVLPGYVETDMTKDMSISQKASIVRRTPIGRLGRIADIAPAILFLASDSAGFITGQSLVVDGGATC